MNCLVCGKEFKGTVCPVCQFPIVEIPGDYESGLKALQPTIQKHRAAFAEQITMELEVFEYQIDNAAVRERGSQNLNLGKVSDMINNVVWAGVAFENPSLRQNIEMTVIIGIAGAKKEKRKVVMPTPKTEEKISLGIFCDNDFNFQIVLKDGKGTQVTSQKNRIIR